jgi:hypothetical protein
VGGATIGLAIRTTPTTSSSGCCCRRFVVVLNRFFASSTTSNDIPFLSSDMVFAASSALFGLQIYVVVGGFW